NFRYIMRDVGVILAKANQALPTLEKYRAVFQQSLTNLTALEFEELATLYDVPTCAQRAQMAQRIRQEIERYIVELGTGGRLGRRRLGGRGSGTQDEGYLIVRDYWQPDEEGETAADVWRALNEWSSDHLLELRPIARRLGYGSHMHNLDHLVTPRAYR